MGKLDKRDDSMHIGGSITDELREWTKGSTLSSWTAEHLTAIADRIDAEHERAMADAYLSGTPTDEKLTELGWIRLPKDADGEYIHVGDVMELTRLSNKPSFEVRAMRYDEGGWEVFDRLGDRYEPFALRHHHAPTVEDVLREFFSRYVTTKPKEEDDAILAEFATKLRLAGDAE